MPRNTQRLLQLAEHLRFKVRDNQFNIHHWFNSLPSAEAMSPTEVRKYFDTPGRTGCGGGHAITLFGWPTQTGRDMPYALKIIFGITSNQLNGLFASGVTSRGLNRLQQANVIEHFAKTGVITYTVKDNPLPEQPILPQAGDMVLIEVKIVSVPTAQDYIQVKTDRGGTVYVNKSSVKKLVARKKIEVGHRIKSNTLGLKGFVLAISKDKFAFVEFDGCTEPSVAKLEDLIHA